MDTFTNPQEKPHVEGYADALWWWCGPCGRWLWSGPGHEASARCRSGAHPHCSCSTCF